MIKVSRLCKRKVSSSAFLYGWLLPNGEFLKAFVGGHADAMADYTQMDKVNTGWYRDAYQKGWDMGCVRIAENGAQVERWTDPLLHRLQILLMANASILPRVFYMESLFGTDYRVWTEDLLTINRASQIARIDLRALVS